MSKRIEEILEGMPPEDLRVKEDYRDDGLRVMLAVNYLIGYLGRCTPENIGVAYSGMEIAELLYSVCKGVRVTDISKKTSGADCAVGINASLCTDYEEPKKAASWAELKPSQ